jgi:hypothetical protein
MIAGSIILAFNTFAFSLDAWKIPLEAFAITFLTF